MTKQLIITFETDEDAEYFTDYHAAANATDHTVTGLTNGLMSTAMRAAKVAAIDPKQVVNALNKLDILTNIPAFRQAANNAGYMAQFQTAKHAARLALTAFAEFITE